jgi:hypothetical protein
MDKNNDEDIFKNVVYDRQTQYLKQQGHQAYVRYKLYKKTRIVMKAQLNMLINLGYFKGVIRL